MTITFDLTHLTEAQIDTLDKARDDLKRYGVLVLQDWSYSHFESETEQYECESLLRDFFMDFGCDIQNKSDSAPRECVTISTPVNNRSFREWREIQRNDLKQKQVAVTEEKADKEQKWWMDYRLKWAGWVVALLGLLVLIVIRATQK